MITSIVFNFLIGLLALSLSSSVALHDSRLDTAFVGLVNPTSDTATHDVGHAVSHDLHVHGNRTSVGSGDPILASRLYKKHTNASFTRLKLAALHN